MRGPNSIKIRFPRVPCVTKLVSLIEVPSRYSNNWNSSEFVCIKLLDF